ncbi:hypothetical protein [Psychromarinibacter sp. S121]|uniref:hypothetical protein n=1 Tax=Psychromarinibacter sp. S121 TaxID=3415127 RepID=UPI003C7DDB17
MKQIVPAVLCAAMLVAPLPAVAQDDSEMSEGLSLLEEGTKLLLRGLMNEMGPAMEEMSEELRGAIKDMSAYHAPEVLPNGDILIRRKVPLQVEPEIDPESGPEIGEDGEVEL